MRARALPIAVVALASGLAATLVIACSSFSSDEATAAPDGALPDASAPSDSATSLEATTDAAEASVRFCLAHPDVPLCADFDGTNEPVSFHFEGFTGDVQLDPVQFVSPPHGMKATGDAGASFVRVQTTAAALAQKQRLSFDVRLEVPAGKNTSDGVFVSLSQGATGCTFDLESFGASARLNIAIPGSQGGVIAYQNHPLKAYPVPGRFDRAELSLSTLSATTVEVKVAISGVAALTTTVNCPALSASPQLRLGLLDVSGGDQFASASYDNVLLESP